MTPVQLPPSHPENPLPEGRFQGHRRFEEVVRLALSTAAHEGWSSLYWSDPDFADWPLGERSVIADLDAWAGRGRQLFLLAHDFSALRLAHPRLVTWRTRWSHLVQARACAPGRGGELPSALLGPAWTLERIDPRNAVCVTGSDAAQRVRLRERWAACWEQGQDAFPATTLGL